MKRLFACISFLMVLICSSGSAWSYSVTLDFESVPTTTVNGAGGVGDPYSYFASYGITLSQTYQTGRAYGNAPLLAVYDVRWIYDNGADSSPYVLQAPSGFNVFSQVWNNGPLTFTLNFDTPLTSFSFQTAGLTPWAPPTSFPAWAAEAYDSSHQVVGSALSWGTGTSGTYIFSTLNPAITSVTFFRDGTHGTAYQNYSAFSHVFLDNLVLTRPDSAPVPEPATMILLASGLAGLAGIRKRLKG